MRTSNRLLPVLLSVTLTTMFLGACQRDDPNDLTATKPSRPGNSTPGPAPTGTQVTSPQEHTPSSRPSASAVATQSVELIEYQIRMPQTLASGKQTFTIVNAGKEQHGFVIEGNGQRASRENLMRGDSGQVEVNLPAGTYEVWCPVDGHKEKGMRTTVTVTPGQS